MGAPLSDCCATLHRGNCTRPNVGRVNLTKLFNRQSKGHSSACDSYSNPTYTTSATRGHYLNGTTLAVVTGGADKCCAACTGNTACVGYTVESALERTRCRLLAKPTTAHRRANSSVGTMDMPYSGLKQIPTEFDYWRDNIPVKTNGGIWYSTSGAAECVEGRSGPCAWRVAESVKKVNKTCADASINAAVVRSSAFGRHCFGGCTRPLNSSDACFIRCWYKTVLGESAGTMYLNSTTVGGISLAALEAAWNGPFDSIDPTKGGCADMLAPGKGGSRAPRGGGRSAGQVGLHMHASSAAT